MINLREIIIGALMDIVEEEQYSHIVLKDVLEKYQYLDKRDRAFITRVTEGTLENMLQMDYIIERFSKVKVENMKLVIRNILRMSVYQLKYMDSVPASAACNEAVKLAKKKGFGQLSGFVNGVLRGVSRGLDQLTYPKESVDAVKAWSVRYSMPEWIVAQWIGDYGKERTKEILAASLLEAPITVRANLERITPEALAERFKVEGVTAVPLDTEKYPGLSYVYTIFGFDHLNGLSSFKEGLFYVQDPASRLAVLAAGAKPGMKVLDCCAAPGGKSFAAAIAMENQGEIVSCDLHPHKKKLIQAGADRLGLTIISPKTADGKVFRPEWENAFDLVLVDAPCSGLGVIRKKPDIRYKDPAPLADLPAVQLDILRNAARYVKPGGTLMYSTCTLLYRENGEVVETFLAENKSYKAETFTLPGPVGPVQSGSVTLWPHRHGTDGFFISKMRREEG